MRSTPARTLAVALAAVLALVAGASAAALSWPGQSSVTIVDDSNVFTDNLSGLAYQSSGSAAPGVLWAVRNGPSTMFRLVWTGTKWTPDANNGWATGKNLSFPNGAGEPDAEGVTFADGDVGALYVSSESDNTVAGSRPSVLRYDVTGAGNSLTATREWDLTADLPGLGANLGPEAITWIPDSLLVAKGFIDDATGRRYDPATYPNHGTGLFLLGIEQDGRIIAYALDLTAGTYKRVAEFAKPFPQVMDLHYEAESTHLWAVCDNTCQGQTATLDIAQSGPNTGHFEVTSTYDRPTGMPNLNNEGFTITPAVECVNRLKPVYWAEDNNSEHALRAGTIACGPPLPTPTPTPQATATPVPTATPAPAPAPQADRTAPSVKLALRFAKSGTFAVRRTGKFRLTITLGERADLAITVTARKNAKAKARTILRTTRKGVAAGKPALTLSLKSSVRKALRKGETVTVTVKATDAAKNVTTRRVSAKVP